MAINSNADIIRTLLRGHWYPYLPFDPSPKQLAFCALPHTEALYGGAAGSGKLIPLDEVLPSPNGWVTMGSLRVGDSLFDEKGKVCKVTKVYETNPEPSLVQFTFDDGTTVVSCVDHQWVTMTDKERELAYKRRPEYREERQLKRPSRAGGNRSASQTAGIVLSNKTRKYNYLSPPAGEIRTTQQIVNTLRYRGRANHSIPVAEPIQLPEKEYLLDPYLLGCWLGDGSAESGRITGLDEEIFTAFVEAGFVVREHKNPVSKGILGLFPILKKLGVAGNKHVPAEYLWGSINQRLALLQGLMDTDGYVDSNGHCEFTNTNKALAETVVQLINSLGNKAVISEGRATLNGKDCGPKYRISWSGTLCPFRLSRKVVRWKPPKTPSTRLRYIIKADFVASRPGKCIQVDSSKSLFLVGRQMVPTHNSAVLLMDALRYVDVPNYAAIIFRRSLTDLKRNGGLLDLAFQWLGPRLGKDCYYEASTHMFKWANNASLTFGYIGSATAWEHYQGGNYQYIGWDELTQHSQQDYGEMFSRLRRNGCALHADFPQPDCNVCVGYKHLRNVPLKVRGTCVDSGDVLTEGGWKPIQDILPGEKVYSVSSDGCLQLKEVLGSYQNDWDGSLIRIKKKNLYMSFTPEHRLVHITRRGKYKIVPWEDHKGSSLMLARAPLSLEAFGVSYTDDELAFLGLFLAEGCTNSVVRRGNYKVVVTQCKKENQSRIADLLTRLGYNWNLSKNGDFQITNKALWERFRVFGKAHQKYVPRDILKNATKEQLEILFSWMVFGDGSQKTKEGSITYVTSSKQLADDVSEIGLKLSYKVMINHQVLPNPNHNDRYNIYLTQWTTTPVTLVDKGLVRNDVTSITYKGKVYCLKVEENENFIIRQKGVVWISGNTNPGGRGHIWVKKRFKLFKNKASKIPNPITLKNEMWESGDPEKPYLPGFFVDNPGLDHETYKKNLKLIGDRQREAQLLEGDWDWVAGGVFDPGWFLNKYEYRNGYYAILSPTTGIATGSFHEKSLRIFTVVDVACSVREGMGDRSFRASQGGELPASWTVIGTFGLTPKNELLVLDIKRFQQEAPAIFDGIKKTCHEYRPMYVALEANGPGKPIAQMLHQMGVPIKEVITFVDKPSNSAEAQVRCKQGKVLLPKDDSAIWVNDFLGEVTTWTGHPHETDDQVDVLSNACHEFTRLCGNMDRKAAAILHARDLPFVSKKHGRIFDYPTQMDLLPYN